MKCPYCHQEIEVPPVIIASGEDFENYLCGQINSLPGVSCQTTKATGDQGVDLVISLGGDGGEKRIAVQCKLYSSPVGNDAVQEVIAGRIFYKCDLAMVVSNNTYTESAKALAAAADVALLDYRDFRDHIKQISGVAERERIERGIEEERRRALEIANEEKRVQGVLGEMEEYLKQSDGSEEFGAELRFLVREQLGVNDDARESASLLLSMAIEKNTGLLPPTIQFLKYAVADSFSLIIRSAELGRFGKELREAMVERSSTFVKEDYVKLTPARKECVDRYIQHWDSLFDLFQLLRRVECNEDERVRLFKLRLEDLPPRVKECIEKMMSCSINTSLNKTIIEAARRTKFEIKWNFGDQVPWASNWQDIKET